jgi:hypothetical protein
MKTVAVSLYKTVVEADSGNFQPQMLPKPLAKK